MRQSDVGYRDTHFKSVNDSWFTQTLQHWTSSKNLEIWLLCVRVKAEELAGDPRA